MMGALPAVDSGGLVGGPWATSARSSASSCGVLALKNGSISTPPMRTGANGTGIVPCRSVQCSTLRTPCASCASRSSASATGQRPITGCSSPCDWASGMARSRPPAAVQQAGDEVRGEERRVAGGGCDPARRGRVGGRPAHAGEDAGERADEAFNRVGDDGQAELGEAGRIAVGVDGDAADLGPQAIEDVLQHGLAGEVEQALVAAAHAPRLPAGEDDARDVGLPAHRRILPFGYSRSNACARGDARSPKHMRRPVRL